MNNNNNNNKDQDNMETSKELSGEEKLLHLMDGTNKDKKFTAEEKLLHVIENEKKEEDTEDIDNTGESAAPSDENNKSIKDTPLEKPSSAHFKIPAFLSNISFPKIDIANIDIKKISLATVNKTLIVAGVILTVIFAFYIMGEKRNVGKRIDRLKSMNIEENSMTVSIDKSTMPEIGEYIIETQKNNPFHLLPEDQIRDVAEIIEKPLKLKLVGILWADTAQAIIEDLNSGKTFIVEENDIVGEYTIVKITQLEVRLDSNGEEKILE